MGRRRSRKGEALLYGLIGIVAIIIAIGQFLLGHIWIVVIVVCIPLVIFLTIKFAKGFNKKNKVWGMIMKPKKIDVAAYGVSSRFGKVHEDSLKGEVAAYKSGDYLSFIKYRCLGFYYSAAGAAFDGAIGTVVPVEQLFSGYKFPTSGKDHNFMAFKKLNIETKILELNASFESFFQSFKSDLIQIWNMMIDHKKRLREMDVVSRVDLLKFLHERYDGTNNIGIYAQYYIFENQYLHQQFDRFVSAKDFYEWWERDALKILHLEDGFEPKSVWDDLKLLLKTNGGILQSDFYKMCNDSKEEVSSTLYFAEKDGELIRKKEGRSYRLYLPEQVKDAM
jgi:hypothetical protein